jgi:hypothetical protein
MQWTCSTSTQAVLLIASSTLAAAAQIGMSKDRMLRLFHPDALDLLNITNSLKQVAEDLASPSSRMARKVRRALLLERESPVFAEAVSCY